MLSHVLTPCRYCGYRKQKFLHRTAQWSFWWWTARYCHHWLVESTLAWATEDHFHHLSSRAFRGAKSTLDQFVSYHDSLREPWEAVIFCRRPPRVWSLLHFLAETPAPFWLGWSRLESAWSCLQLNFQASLLVLKHDFSHWHPCCQCV